MADYVSSACENCSGELQERGAELFGLASELLRIATD